MFLTICGVSRVVSLALRRILVIEGCADCMLEQTGTANGLGITLYGITSRHACFVKSQTTEPQTIIVAHTEPWAMDRPSTLSLLHFKHQQGTTVCMVSNAVCACNLTAAILDEMYQVSKVRWGNQPGPRPFGSSPLVPADLPETDAVWLPSLLTGDSTSAAVLALS